MLCSIQCTKKCARSVWKARGLTLLLRVGTLWRCGDGLFFEVPPLARDALLTKLHPLVKVLQTVDHLEISCLGAHFSWLEKPRNRMGRDLNWILCSGWKKWIGGSPLDSFRMSSKLNEIQASTLWNIQEILESSCVTLFLVNTYLCGEGLVIKH
jgi:hypothetical protein